MKATILAVGDFPEGGAASVRLKLLAATLCAGGIPACVALMHAATKKPIQENQNLRGEVEGIPFVYLNGNVLRPAGIIGALADTLRGIMAAVRLVARQKTDGSDVLVFYTPKLLKFAMPLLVAKLRGVPVIVEACEIWSKATDLKDASVLRRLANSGDILLESVIPKLANGIIAISRPIRNYYSQRGAGVEQLYLLPILVDTVPYIAVSSSVIHSLQGKKYFLNSGAFAEKDGVAFVLSAFERVASKHADLYLVFTGHVPESVRTEALGRMGNHALMERILFVGFLTRDELIWCYQNACALLSCRSNSPYANYGLSTKLGEYLAAGAPVIATRVGDTHYYLRDGEDALIAEPENVDSIADCMERVLSQAGLAQKLSVNGRCVAEKEFHYLQHGQPLVAFVKHCLCDQRLGGGN